MRKPVLFAVLIMLLCCSQAQAQAEGPELPSVKGNREVAVGYGVLSLPVLVAGAADVLTLGFFSQGEEVHVAGPLMLNYTFGFDDRWSAGMLATYTGYIVKHEDTGELDYRKNYYSLMPRIDYHYSKRTNVDVYSGLALGATYLQNINRDEGNHLLYACHLNAIGMRFGKKVGGFCELGFGMNGLLNAGVSVRL